ncbi:Minf_1886 family protein [Aeoliella mucimassa]|uniref:Uncharacterized protein n=1 Tax=Aeoliella mucimassa TaxID=2527972 RepID=A0A518AUQ6_9BACT|nr:Minf_1886 family protein [Aeoliella mucimassa]QDU58459.1 hypothetical protein Pan181_46950 [Aeoliella mucimassa]
MLDPGDPMVDLLERDKRYKFDAYLFVFDALHYGQTRLDMGKPYAPEEPTDLEDFENLEDQIEHHVSGQDLCEAIRQFALEQYGLMARAVLADWGIRSTGDFGNIVFNLIDIKKMKKTEHDRREDFENVYDFDQAFRQEFKFSAYDPKRGI